MKKLTHIGSLQWLKDTAEVINQLFKINHFIAVSIFALPLFIVSMNYTVVDQLDPGLPYIKVINSSSSQEGNRLEEVFTALTLPEGEEYKPDESEYLFQNYNQDKVEDNPSSAELVKTNVVDLVIDIPNDFGSDNQNDRVQGRLSIVGNRANNSAVRVAETVVTEVLQEYNEELNEKAIGRPPVEYYGIDYSAIEIEENPVILEVNRVVFLVALPSLLYLLVLYLKKRHYKSKINLLNHIKGSWYELLAITTILATLQAIVWVYESIKFEGSAIELAASVLLILQASLALWLVAIVITQNMKFTRTRSRKTKDIDLVL
jgi:hypothetical protein